MRITLHFDRNCVQRCTFPFCAFGKLPFFWGGGEVDTKNRQITGIEEKEKDEKL
jgi:hypothetical protein